MSNDFSFRSTVLAGAGLLCAALLVIALSVLLVDHSTPSDTETSGADVAGLLGGNALAGFAKARPGVAIEFPRDHGAHEDYQIEWWYFTGNLADPAGNRFGYQVTLFRFASSPEANPLDSDFASNQTWMAHLAVTDVDGKRFYASERFSRQSPGLAGVTHSPFSVWVGDWQIDGEAHPACNGCLAFDMQLQTEEVSLSLGLSPTRPLVLQGVDGFSAKTRDGDTGSHYYSMTRLDTAGELRIGERRISVTGQSWLDREWSSSNLGKSQAGWDWFALQLENGEDLMVYRLRRGDGTTDTAYSVVVGDTGRSGALDGDALEIVPTRYWTSADTGTRYPVSWEIRDADTALEVNALLDRQEHDGVFRYWEGAVSVTGSRAGKATRGLGYLEMTGYGAAKD